MTRTDAYFRTVFGAFCAWTLASLAIIAGIKHLEKEILEVNVAAEQVQKVELREADADYKRAMREIAKSGASKSQQAVTMLEVWGEK